MEAKGTFKLIGIVFFIGVIIYLITKKNKTAGEVLTDAQPLLGGLVGDTSVDGGEGGANMTVEETSGLSEETGAQVEEPAQDEEIIPINSPEEYTPFETDITVSTPEEEAILITEQQAEAQGETQSSWMDTVNEQYNENVLSEDTTLTAEEKNPSDTIKDEGTTSETDAGSYNPDITGESSAEKEMKENKQPALNTMAISNQAIKTAQGQIVGLSNPIEESSVSVEYSLTDPNPFKVSSMPVPASKESDPKLSDSKSLSEMRKTLLQSWEV